MSGSKAGRVRRSWRHPGASRGPTGRHPGAPRRPPGIASRAHQVGHTTGPFGRRTSASRAPHVGQPAARHRHSGTTRAYHVSYPAWPPRRLTSASRAPHVRHPGATRAPHVDLPSASRRLAGGLFVGRPPHGSLRYISAERRWTRGFGSVLRTVSRDKSDNLGV